MKSPNHKELKDKSATQIDQNLDKLEDFFPAEKMERAKARLAKAKTFLKDEHQQNSHIHPSVG